MVAVYITLIQKGLWTIDKVPERWRADVESTIGKEE